MQMSLQQGLCTRRRRMRPLQEPMMTGGRMRQRAQSALKLPTTRQRRPQQQLLWERPCHRQRQAVWPSLRLWKLPAAPKLRWPLHWRLLLPLVRLQQRRSGEPTRSHRLT
jgi:hypothetical protein